MDRGDGFAILIRITDGDICIPLEIELRKNNFLHKINSNDHSKK